MIRERERGRDSFAKRQQQPVDNKSKYVTAKRRVDVDVDDSDDE